MNVRHSRKIILFLLMFILLLLPSTLPFAEAATLVVTSRADSGAGSLRQAFLSVIPGDVITFDATVFPPANPATIRLLTALPDITLGNLTIDGSNAGVVLDGTYTPAGTRGFRITSNGNVIKGLKIINFPNDGIEITNGAKNNTIGGDWTIGSAPRGEGNIITLNGDDGVDINGTGTNDNIVSGNLIGLDADGTRDIRVQAMAISPNYTNDQTLFIGTKFNGVFKTTDGGTAWAEVSNGLTMPDVRSLAISPNYTSDGTLFAGTRTGGIFKTTNGGVTWTRVDGGVTLKIVSSLVISPAYSTDGQIFAATNGDGVLASTDRGNTWATRNGGVLNGVGVAALVISPNYAADRTLFTLTGNTLYKSINQGYAWTLISSSLTGNPMSMAISPNFPNDQTFFAGVGCNSGPMFIKSMDGGNSWLPLGSDISACAVYALAFSPNYTVDKVLFAVINHGGIFKSNNGGTTWLKVDSTNQNYAIAVSPAYATDQTLFVGNMLGSIYKSSTGGESFQRLNTGLTEEGNSHGIRIVNGAQDNVIGGNSINKRNIISNNGEVGVRLSGINTSNNMIIGNYIALQRYMICNLQCRQLSFPMREISSMVLHLYP